MVVEYGGSGLAVNVSIENVAWHVESGVVADGSIGDILGRPLRERCEDQGIHCGSKYLCYRQHSRQRIHSGHSSAVVAIDSGDDSIGILSTNMTTTDMRLLETCNYEKSIASCIVTMV